MINEQEVRWDRIKRRLRQSMLASERTDARDESRRDTVYRRRAARFAATGNSVASNQKFTQIIAFVVGEQSYGFPLSDVARVYPMARCTPVPLAPSWLLGIASFDSHFRSVLDLRVLLDGAPARNDATGNILLIRAGRSLLGIRVDQVTGIQEVDLAALTAPEADAGQGGGGLIWGQSSKGLTVIRVDAIAERIAVQA